MRPFFSILALAASLILLAGFASAVVAPGWCRFAWRMAAIGATLGIDATACVSLAWLGSGVARRSVRLRLPDWVAAQVEKNGRKSLIYFAFGLPILGLAVGSDLILGAGPVALGLQAANLSFQLGAFFGMSVVLAAQARLFREVSDWANSPGL